MKGVRELRRRLKGVQNIKKITKAMEMVAATKLRRLQDRALATRPFADHIQAMVQRVAASVPAGLVDLLHIPDETRQEALVVVGADKGLCGSYNSNLFRATLAHLRRLEGEEVKPHLHLFGRRAQLFFGRMRNIEVAQAYPEQVEKVDYRSVRRVLKPIVQGFLENRFQRVCVVYTRMRSLTSFLPTVQQLLPVPRAGQQGDEEGGLDYIMEPSPEQILRRLLPRFVEVQLYAAVLESLASEFASRRMAMKSATDNAEEMTHHLTMEYNKARQTGITGELLEIVGGAEALKG